MGIARLPHLFDRTGAFVVADRSQPFVDRTMVRSTEHVSFTLHPARRHPANPVVRADRPWEGWRLEIYGTVLYDAEDRCFKMWYIGESPAHFPEYATLYATSVDGIVWEKPLVGAVHCPLQDRHNAVVANCDITSVMKDTRDPDPGRRYKLLCWDRSRHGYHSMVSPDGLRWTRVSQHPICPEGDVITCLQDPATGRFHAFPKLQGMERGQWRRCFGWMVSDDFEAWSDPRIVLAPDLRDDAGSLARIEQVRGVLDMPDDPDLMRTEFYGLGLYRAEDCLLGFPWVFTVSSNARFGNQEGPGEIQLAVTRDMETWDRPFRTPCVPRGEPGEWDHGFFTTASQAIRVGDEVWLYYTGSTYTHGTPCLYRAEGTGRLTEHTGSIGLAIWQVDRFVSADAPAAGATLTTVPVVFTGTRLELNVRTASGGAVVVDALDAGGRTIASSQPVAGDDLRAPVRWESGFDLAALAGMPVALRFRMHAAELFAFAFRQ